MLHKILLTLIAILAVFGCQRQSASPSTLILQGQQDPAAYSTITLGNGLKVLLVSDNKLLNAYGSLSVNAGYFQDPENLPGLAHLYEHMLSKGTKDYPATAEYKQYLADNGGKSNASTSAYSSNYYFEVSANKLAPTLMRFADQFIAPLLNEEMVYKERHAVNAEFKLKFQDNFRRKREVLRLLVNANHPYRHFSTGNLATLQDTPNATLHQAIVQFSKDYYCASRMAVVVASPQPLTELAKMAKMAFSGVANDCEQVLSDAPEVFSQSPGGKVINIQTLSKRSTMTLSFVVPDNNETQHGMVTEYIAWLLESSHKHGLVQHLKQGDLIKSLNVTQSTIDQNHSLFNIKLNLTKSGVERPQQLLSSIFAYINTIKTTGLESSFTLFQQLQQSRFHQDSSHKSSSDIRALAEKLLFQPASTVLTSGAIAESFDQAVITLWLDKLDRTNLLVIQERPILKDAPILIEPIYQTRYQFQPAFDFSVENHPFQLPSSLGFIALQDKGKTLAFKTPHQLIQSNTLNSWYLPKAIENDTYSAITLYIDKPQDLLQDGQFASLNPLMAKYMNTALTDVIDQAKQVNINIDIDAITTGLRIRVSGHNGNWPAIFELLTHQLSQLPVEQKWLERSKRSQLSSLNGFSKKRLKDQSHQWLYQALDLAPSIKIQQQVIRNSDQDTLQNFINQYTENSHLTLFFFGHIQQQDQLDIHQTMQVLTQQNSTPGGTRVTFRLDQLTINSQSNTKAEAAALVVQTLADENLESVAVLHLLGTAIKAPFFNQLRTQEQLGYSVTAGLKHIHGHAALAYYVQSPAISAEKIYQRIEQFTAWFNEDLQNLGTEQYALMQQNATTKIAQSSINSDSAEKRLRTHIRFGNGADYDQQLHKQINTLSLERFKTLTNALLSSPLRGVLTDAPLAKVNASKDL